MGEGAGEEIAFQGSRACTASYLLIQVDDDELDAQNICDALDDEGLAGACTPLSVKKGLKAWAAIASPALQSEQG